MKKYAGDCLLQKFYTVDFLTKKVAPNHGERPQYYVEDGHDPVVPKGIFLQVQAERERRRFHGPEFRYVHGIGLSGKIFCEDCGLPFRRKDDHGYKYWYCESGRKSRHPDSECHNGRIREEKLQEIVIAAFNQLPEHEQDLMHLQARVRVMGIDKADEMLKQIDGEIESTTGEEQERLRVQRHEIAEQRTVYADKDVQIRSLLDRIAAIRGVKTPF